MLKATSNPALNIGVMLMFAFEWTMNRSRLLDRRTERENENILLIKWWYIPIMKKKAKLSISSEMETFSLEETVVSLKLLVLEKCKLKF